MSYRLLWQDLFDQNGKPNPTLWTHETGGHGFGNNESQFYTDRLENSYVKDGHLYIVAKKENHAHRQYTSAKLITYPNKLICKGRIEVMAKLPKGKGTWPAIWLLGEQFKKDTPWPLCGEIDMMEHVGQNPNHVQFSLHTKNAYFHLNNQAMKEVVKEGLTDEFHLYSMDWEDDQITFYLDQEPQISFKKKANATVQDWPFDQPFYLILNIALGGTWGGPIDDQALPAYFVFRYIKVYEKVDE